MLNCNQNYRECPYVINRNGASKALNETIRISPNSQLSCSKLKFPTVKHLESRGTKLQITNAAYRYHAKAIQYHSDSIHHICRPIESQHRHIPPPYLNQPLTTLPHPLSTPFNTHPTTSITNSFGPKKQEQTQNRRRNPNVTHFLTSKPSPHLPTLSNLPHRSPTMPDLTKYQSMLNAGVLPQAVRQSMAMDGVDPALLFNAKTTSSRTLLREESHGKVTQSTKLRATRLRPKNSFRTKQRTTRNGKGKGKAQAKSNGFGNTAARPPLRPAGPPAGPPPRPLQQNAHQYAGNGYESQAYQGESSYGYAQQYASNTQNMDSQVQGQSGYQGNYQQNDYNQQHYQQQQYQQQQYQQQPYASQNSQAWGYSHAQQQQQPPRTQFEEARARAYPTQLRPTLAMTEAEKAIYEAESMGSSTRSTMARIQERAAPRRRRASSMAESTASSGGSSRRLTRMRSKLGLRAKSISEKGSSSGTKARRKRSKAFGEKKTYTEDEELERKRNSPNQEEKRTQDDEVIFL